MTGTFPEPGSAPHDHPEAQLPPIPILSPLLARRLGARVLDPDAAPLAPGQPGPLPTVYVADTLLVRSSVGHSEFGDRLKELRDVANNLPEPIALEIAHDQLDGAMLAEGATAGDATGRVTVTRVRLRPAGDGPAPAPDAWHLLQAARAARSTHAPDEPPADDTADATTPAGAPRRRESVARGISLEHVLTAGGGVWGGGGGVWGGGGGVWGGGGGVWGGGGVIAEYGSPGMGGRTPVVVPGADPREHAPPTEKPPVVAVLDTGIGVHPWFKHRHPDGRTECRDGIVDDVRVDMNRIGVFHDPNRDPEHIGAIIDPLNGLVDAFCGHGTFVAGIIRQRCPQATILSIPVMSSDGAALEGDVILALRQLLDRHLQAANTGEDETIDVVNLSLGYYHESPRDALDDNVLVDLLREYSAAGIAVVAAAGNDGTSARFFPAGYASFPADSGHQPIEGLAGVGAVNPDGRTVAMFSNNGDWVRTHAPGTAIVSTIPTELSGSRQAAVRHARRDPVDRATVDWDDYRSGFAIWSGTSFAAPWIAGEIAAQIIRDDTGCSEPDAARTGANPSRALAALSTVVDDSNARLTAV
jgi:serine protease